MDSSKFEDHLGSLLRTSAALSQIDKSVSKKRLWTVWCNKLFSAFGKAESKVAFKPMFEKYLEDFRDLYTKPIFTEKEDGGTVVNDSHLKSSQLMPAPGVSTTCGSEDENSWSPQESVCKGHVIYFSNTNPKFRAVSLPIGEVYQCSIAMKKEHGADDIKIANYPAQILLDLYGIFLALEPQNEKFQDNYDELSDFLDSRTVEDVNPLMDGISKMFGSLMGPAGMSGDKTSDIFSSLLGADAMKSVNKTVNDIVSKMTCGSTEPPKSFQDLVGKVASMFEGDENFMGMFMKPGGTSDSAGPPSELIAIEDASHPGEAHATEDPSLQE